MKKLLALLLSAALITPTAATALTAQNTDIHESSSSVVSAVQGMQFVTYAKSGANSVNVSLTAKQGDIITVYVKIKNVDNAAGLFGQFISDKTALKYTGFSSPYPDNYANQPNMGYVLYNILFGGNGTSFHSETTVATFTFQARKDISSSDSVLSFSVKEFYDNNLMEISSTDKIFYTTSNGGDNSDDTDTSTETHTHTVVTDAAVAPTCTQTGLTEGSHCSSCGDVITAQTTIPAKGHTTVTDSAVAPTCTQTGLTEGSHCSVCGEIITAQTTIPAKGHTTVTDSAVAPTCTQTGLTEGSHCSVCGEIITAQTTIPAKGHTTVTDSAVAPTCTQTGLTEGSHCSVCGYIITAQSTIPAKGHSYVDGKCTDCGQTDPNYSIPHVHTLVTDAAISPTCTQTGLTEGSHCSECGEIIKAQTIVPAKGHTEIKDPAVAPTCTKTGLTEGSHCSVCGYIITAQSTIPAKGHSYVDGKCTDCGEQDPNYTPSDKKGTYGDINGDGRISGMDGFMVLRHIASLSSLSDHQKILADVDGDGKIKSIDVLEILRYAARYNATTRIGEDVQ